MTDLSKPTRKARGAIASKTSDIVSGGGTDTDIAERCAASVSGWESLTERQQSEVIHLTRSFWGRASGAVVKRAVGEGGLELEAPDWANRTLHDLRLFETFATNSGSLLNERMTDLAAFFARKDEGAQLSAALAFVRGANAADPIQSSMAVQMVATHDAVMQALRLSRNSEEVENFQVFGNLAVKLMNAYTRQAETLAKLQRGGEQIIKHIHIDNRGGQAVVTDQLVTGGHHAESREQPHEAGTWTAGVSPALPSPNALRNSVPVPSDEGKEAVQDTRRKVSRSTQGKRQRA